MQNRKLLITAAAGKTGMQTVRNLIGDGHVVRVLVHSDDERSDALREIGAEICIGDLLVHDDVIRATQGVSGAYLCFPVRPGLIQATAYFAETARRAGLEFVVNMSQISAREDSKSHAARDHWIAERVLEWSGVPTITIRPTFFSDWMIYPWVRDSIVNEGKIAFPYASGRHAPISAEDQGRVIAALLAQPFAHIGKTYALYGLVERNQQEVADVVSKVLGRKVVYTPMSIDQYGLFAGTNDIVRKMTGKPPQSLEAFIEANRAAFEVE